MILEKNSAYSSQKIQRSSDILLRKTILELDDFLSDTNWRVRSEEDQLDKGIDYQIELEADGKTIMLFKIQNKGRGKQLFPLKKTSNKGLIPYTLSIRHARYFRNELPLALIFTVCDIETNKVYWHPIQLDDSIDDKIIIAEDMGAENITIHIDPQKILSTKTIEPFLQDVKRSVVEQHTRFNSRITHPLLIDHPTIEIDKSKHILDQLKEYLSWAHSQMSYYPIDILIQNYPFKLEKTSSSYYADFKLVTDNLSYLELFENFDIKNSEEITITNHDYFKNVTNPLDKLTCVLYALTDNLIFGISTKGSNIHSCRLNHNPLTDLEHNYFTLKWREVLIYIKESSKKDNVEEKMILSFIHYKLGNFLYAAQILESTTKATKKRQAIRYYINKYNLQNLSIFLDNNYWGTKRPDTFINKLKKINIDILFDNLRNEENSAVLQKIRDNDFFNIPREEIISTKSGIIDFYYSQLNGGYGYNNYGLSLINDFATLEYFINRNQIMYDHFSEFHHLADHFIEAIFASLATKGESRGKIEYLNEWLIEQIIFYGDSDKISTYFHRYNLKELPYSEIQPDNNFTLKLKNLLDIDGLDSLVKDVCEDNNQFWKNYTRVFANSVVLLSYLNVGQKEVIELSKPLLHFISNEKFIRSYTFEKLSLLLRRKGHFMSDEIILAFLKAFVQKSKMHSDKFVNAFESIFENRNIDLKFADNDFETIINLLFEKCALCGVEHDKTWSIVFYNIVSDKLQKEQIKLRITSELKTRFDANLFYVAAIYELVPIDGHFFEMFLADVIQSINKISGKQIFGDPAPSTYPKLNSLLNLAFKYTINLNQKKFDDLRNVSPYYRWLFDMNNFDYTNFDPDWLLEHPTRYYFDEYRSCRAIKKFLISYLSKNHDSKIERTFFNLYGEAEAEF